MCTMSFFLSENTEAYTAFEVKGPRKQMNSIKRKKIKFGILIKGIVTVGTLDAVAYRMSKVTLLS